MRPSQVLGAACTVAMIAGAGSIAVAQPEVDRLDDARLSSMHAAYSPQTPTPFDNRVDTLSQQTMAAIKKAYKTHDPERVEIASQ